MNPSTESIVFQAEQGRVALVEKDGFDMRAFMEARFKRLGFARAPMATKTIKMPTEGILGLFATSQPRGRCKSFRKKPKVASYGLHVLREHRKVVGIHPELSTD